MADKKISQLPNGGAVQTGDLIPIARGAVNYTLSGSVITEKENIVNKDATGGYAGLTLFKINFKNAANTFTSFFTNSNTAARTYTFQNRDGTIADNTDLATKQDTLTATNFGTFSTGLTAKVTPVDADSVNFVDSAASNIEKKVTWANIKATFKTYFDTLYLALTGGTITGNLNFSGNGLKVTGDFSNATRANRLALQTSTVNGNTRVPILPNGTARLAGIDCHDGADADNSSFLQVHSDGTNNHAGLNSAKIGTGTTKDLVFQIDSVTKAQINASDGKFKVLSLAASRNVSTDASGNLQTLAEANYPSLSGTTTATETSGIAVYEFIGAGSLILPTAIGNTAIFMVKNRHTSDITVTFTGGQNADGSTSISLIPYQALQFISNNTNYNIF